jgi:hypothetical protein
MKQRLSRVAWLATVRSLPIRTTLRSPARRCRDGSLARSSVAHALTMWLAAFVEAVSKVRRSVSPSTAITSPGSSSATV